MRVFTWIAWIYAALCLLALVLMAAGSPMFAGDAADPLSSVFAYLLALPWILVLDLLGDTSFAINLAVMVFSMGMNFLILSWLGRRGKTPRAPRG